MQPTKSLHPVIVRPKSCSAILVASLISLPENQWLEDAFPLGWPIFRGELAVSFRECSRSQFS